MTILTVLLLTVVSTCLAQPADDNSNQRSARAPQSQIKYSDPDGLKVDWKLYAPQKQWRTHLESSQRAQRAETGTGQVNFSPKQQTQVSQAPLEVVPRYQPYSAVPNHIKQLIANVYTPEGPYVDPGAFFYKNVVPASFSSFTPQPKADKPTISQAQQVDRAYFNSAVNYRANEPQSNARKIVKVSEKVGIKYKDEEKSSERSSLLPFGVVLDVQSQEKTQYQPYKQTEQSQYGQYKEKSTQASSQYGQYNLKSSQSQSQYGRYKKEDSQSPNQRYETRSPQEQPQYGQYNKQVSQQSSQYVQNNHQVTQLQPQYGQYNKQVSQQSSQYVQNNHQATQLQPQYAQYNKEPSQSQSQYGQYNKQVSQLPRYNKQDSQSQRYKQTSNLQEIKPVSQTIFQKNMPMAIQQLLSYQAQLPYNVIANHILYRPKQLFVPKPLPESAKIGKQYPTKIYFVKTDGQIYDSPEIAKEIENEKRY